MTYLESTLQHLQIALVNAKLKSQIGQTTSSVWDNFIVTLWKHGWYCTTEISISVLCRIFQVKSSFILLAAQPSKLVSDDDIKLGSTLYNFFPLLCRNIVSDFRTIRPDLAILAKLFVRSQFKQFAKKDASEWIS